jgi:hypothetical protein
MKESQTQSAIRRPVSDDATGQLRGLLEEIEHEEVPERLLELAKQLQGELAARRNRGGRPSS